MGTESLTISILPLSETMNHDLDTTVMGVLVPLHRHAFLAVQERDSSIDPSGRWRGFVLGYRFQDALHAGDSISRAGLRGRDFIVGAMLAPLPEFLRARAATAGATRWAAPSVAVRAPIPASCAAAGWYRALHGRARAELV
jgi:hypothetical protein